MTMWFLCWLSNSTDGNNTLISFSPDLMETAAWSSKMAQQVEAPAAKPDNLSSSPEVHTVRKRIDSHKLSSVLHTRVLVHVCKCMHVHTHTYQ